MIIKTFLPILVGCISASGTNKNVVSLTASNFDEKLNQSKFTLIKFFAPWCGHCQAMEEDWKEVADLVEFWKNSDENLIEKREDAVQIAEMDCDAGENWEKCKIEGAEGYPVRSGVV